jgi:catalase
VTNTVVHLGQGVERFVQERAVNDYLSKVDPELGARVARGLGIEKRQPAGVKG